MAYEDTHVMRYSFCGPDEADKIVWVKMWLGRDLHMLARLEDDRSSHSCLRSSDPENREHDMKACVAFLMPCRGQVKPVWEGKQHALRQDSR